MPDYSAGQVRHSVHLSLVAIPDSIRLPTGRTAGEPPPSNGPSSVPPLWQTRSLRLKPGRWSPLGHAENHRADRARDPG